MKTFFNIIIQILFITSSIIQSFASSPPKAIITIQKGSLEDTVPFSINLDGSNSFDLEKEKLTYSWQYPDKKFDKKNPRSYKFSKAGQFEISLTVTNESGLSDKAVIKITAIPKNKNGDLSDKIKITEIFPNPKGKDENNEWLEIFNGENHSINLGNWTINQGKKSTELSDELIIESNSFITLSTKTLGFSLKNSENEISLKNFQEKVISDVTYNEVKEEKSYSKITIQNNNNTKTLWLWTNSSKGRTNPKYQEIHGTISRSDIDHLNFSIQESIIYISEESPKSLYKVLTKEGNNVEITAEETPNGLLLKSLKVQNKKGIIKSL